MNNYQELQFTNANLPIKMHLRIHIPYIHREQAIIQDLAYQYNLDVKILQGNLGGNNDGVFQIELSGIKERIANALNYISALKIDFYQYLN